MLARRVLCTATAVSLAAMLGSAWAAPAPAPVVIHPRTIKLEMPAPWAAVKQVAPRSFETERRSAAGALEAGMTVTVEQRASAAEAVQRLADVEAEYPDKGTFVLLGGWPAFERRILVPFERAGEEAPKANAKAKARGPGREMSYRVTTAVAANDVLIRLETLLQPEAPIALKSGALRPARRRPVEHAPAAPTHGQRLAPPLRPAPGRPLPAGAPSRGLGGGANGPIETTLSWGSTTARRCPGRLSASSASGQCSIAHPSDPGAKNVSPDGWIVEKQMGVKH